MIRHALLIAIILTPIPAFPALAADSPKPNLLFLLADDMRADAIGALGHPVVQTPNLDRLVDRGFAFTNAYCFGSNVPAVCSPSRNMLLSGRTYFRFKGQATPDQANFAGSFKDAGYETYHHGKRGNVAVQLQKVFEHDKYLKDDQAERRSGETGREIVDPAIEFLKNRKTDRPFCMYLAFGNPHDPRGAAEKHLKLYDRKSIPLPKNFKPFHPFNNGELLVRDEQLAPWPRTEDEVRRHLHEYYAVISGLDEQIGRLLATLKELKLEGNTVVIFSSDHGLAVGSHGLFGKQSLYEHSMKAPLVFAGPGVPRGKSAAFAYLHDIFPTACDLCGVAVPSGLDGVSQKPVLAGRKRSMRDIVFTAYRDVQRAVRQDDWKLIVYPKINKTQMFDLSNDPDETRDLSADSSHAQTVRELRDLLRKQQTHYGDLLALDSEKPVQAEVDLTFFKIPPKKK
jgi:arylsulfatase A-like enzyme